MTLELIQNIIKKSNAIGCIGTRDDFNENNNDRQNLCALIGYFLAKSNIRINSGNADGCDSLYAHGANQINPKLVYLYLPFENYNPNYILSGNHVILDPLNPEWVKLARENHFLYDTKLSKKAQCAMNRNVGIVLNSQAIIAMPSRKKSWGGGTGHGIKVAKSLGMPIINLNDAETVENITKLIQNSEVM